MQKKTPISAPSGTQAAADTSTAAKGSSTSEPSNPLETSTNYTVGYGHPPRKTQFKKGQSGNPRGRQKGLRNFRTVIEAELKQKIPLRQGDKVSATTKQRAFVLSLVDDAIRRNPKAIVALITLLRSSGMLDEPAEPTGTEPVTAHDDEIIADFLRRHGASTENAATPKNPTTIRRAHTQTRRQSHEYQGV